MKTVDEIREIVGRSEAGEPIASLIECSTGECPAYDWCDTPDGRKCYGCTDTLEAWLEKKHGVKK